jgi:hypothetical protein
MGRVIKSGRLRSYAACLRVAKSPRLLALMGRVARRRAPLLHDAISIKCGAFFERRSSGASVPYSLASCWSGPGGRSYLREVRHAAEERTARSGATPWRLLAQPPVEATSPIADRRT